MEKKEISGKTTSGIRWTYMSTLLSKGLYPITLIILARLLSPAEFGVVAMAVAIKTFFTCFSDVGLKQAMIRQKGDIEKISSTAFWILLSFGSFCFLVIWIISPYVGMYFKNQEVVPLLRTLGLMFIIQPFLDVPLSMLLKNLEFKALFYRQLFPQLFSGIVSITLAFLGFGSWALIIGALAGITGTSIIVWYNTDWRPRLYIDQAIFKSMFRFGSFVSIQSILFWLMGKVDNLFVGRFLGAHSLGIYRIGYNYGNLPLQLVGGPFHEVIFPIFCKISNNLYDLREKYLLYIKWISLAIIPTGIAFIFIIPDMVPFLLGSKWSSSIPVIQLIIITSILASIGGVNAEAYKAIGRPDINVKFFSIRVIVSLPIYYIAAQKDIVTLALSHVGLTCFFVPINMYICSLVLKIRYLSIIKRSGVGLSLGLIFLIAGVSYMSLIEGNFINNPIINVLCLAIFFIFLGAISLFLIDRMVFTTILEVVRNTFTYKTKEAAL
jgi:O-antigen/teichoic acid export membrane protein